MKRQDTTANGNGQVTRQQQYQLRTAIIEENKITGSGAAAGSLDTVFPPHHRVYNARVDERTVPFCKPFSEG